MAKQEKDDPKFYSAVRPLTPEERKALKDDIKLHGVLTPIIVDQHDHIIDGFHRDEIAKELGLRCPVIVHKGTDEQHRAMALSLNVARRQLTAAQRRDMAIEMKKAGKSLRAIGEKLGVSHEAVRKDTVGVNKLTTDRVVGLDGKSYAARRPSIPDDAAPTVVTAVPVAKLSVNDAAHPDFGKGEELSIPHATSVVV